MIEKVIAEEVSTHVNIWATFGFLSETLTESEAREAIADKLHRLADEVAEGNALEQRYPGTVNVRIEPVQVERSGSQWYRPSVESKAHVWIRVPRGVA